MANILSIDTSTDVGSVSFSKDGLLISNRESFEDRSHAVKTGVFIDEVLAEAEQKGLKPEAVAVCSGPGSYTGLRIGVSLAKGLCYGYNIPLIAIDTLTVLTAALLDKESISGDTLLCPMIDARRMEVYYTLFDTQMNMKKAIAAEVIDGNSFLDEADKTFCFFGNGAEKCKDVLSLPNMHFVKDIYPMARFLSIMAEKAWQNKLFEDVVYFEPFYLKNFVATVSKKNVLER